MAVAIVAACGVWTLVRTGGFTGAFDNDLVVAVDADAGRPRPGAWRRHAADASGLDRRSSARRRRQCRRPTATPSPAPAVAMPKATRVRVTPCPRRMRVNAVARLARVPRPRSRRHRSRRAHRHRLVGVAAEGTVAPADRSWLVVVRGARRRVLHAGAARRGRDRRRVSRQHRRAGVEASRRGAVLGIERRRGPARHADASTSGRVYTLRRHRHPQRARRGHRPRDLVAQRRHRQQHARFRTGASRPRRC